MPDWADIPAHRRDEVERGCIQRLARVLEDLRAEHARAATRLEFADPITPASAVGERLWLERTVAELLIEDVEALIDRYGRSR